MPSTDTVKLTISRLAQAAGVNLETIRYYQRIGLIQKPPKPRQGYRYYDNQSVEQLRFIKRAQQLGFSLHEIADLLSLGSGKCADVRERAEQNRDKIEKQIHDLQKLHKTLNQMILACGNGEQQQPCPIIETLQLQDELAMND